MSTTVIVPLGTLHILPLLRLGFSCTVLAVLLLTFRPLLAGVARAAWLLAFPRLSREQRLRRDQMCDQRLLQKVIAASNSPSLAAELRCMAGRD